MPIAELHEIPDLVTAIVRGKLKVITYEWNPAVNIVWPVAPAYCLAPYLFVEEESKHPDGTRVEGLSALLEEDPENTVIVVCSGSLKAAFEQIEPIGDFKVISFFCVEYLYPYLNDIRNLTNLPVQRSAP
ncbi:MAG: hypothetical protein MJE12_03125, partial [Alphaproteobacteria bacterium]|nr:hypothetical protein [Alphaproteobacteria bacterium]